MGTITTDNFWADQRVKTLPPKGKLVLFYVITQESLIAEDAAMATGVHLSECEDWIAKFEVEGWL